MKPISSRSGFTILELMVVLVIVGILMTVFVFSGSRLFGDAVEKKGKTQLTQLAAMVEEFRMIENLFPDDRLAGGLAANDKNSCCEALFVSLFDEGYTGRTPDQDWLVNTDVDVARKAATRLPDRQLFEIGDPWLNPIVYFESLHYGDEVIVLAGPDGVLEEQKVKARTNEKTGGWEAPGGFQLISAGADGLFGTDDDLVSFGG